MEPLPASFYGKIDKKNPVISAFDTEIKEFMGYMKKLSVSVSGDYESYARGCTNLFHIWNKYKPRLPAYYYDEHLLLVGDFLVQIKMHRLALWQGYGRYLQQFSSVSTDEITDVEQFKRIFFPQGFEAETAGLTFRGLQGRGICCYQLVKESAGSLQHQSSVQTLLRILAFQRLIMQAVLPHERLCWLLYNGTIHIYTISRHLMAMGHSAKVLEYLLWASVCMETSVPLLTVRYLPWRSTLYSAVCQCYYDCQAGLHAEVFARRALSKINELSKLEEMSTSRQSAEVEKAFREATVKVAVMVFKRAVYESRRKPKGLFRPKLKSNLKEVQFLPWPRTSSERLLMEMFDGSAAQFLALLEALWDSSRRLLQTGHSEENEVAEVALELFSAGIDILDGGGGSPGVEEGSVRRTSPVTGIKPEKTLLQLAVTGENGVSVEGAVKLVKLAFHYEQWDSFDHIVHPVIKVLQKLKDPVWKKEELDLKLLIAVEPLYSGHRQRYGQSDSSALGKPSQSERDKPSGPGCGVDDLMNVAETLFACVCTPLQGVRPDRDMVVDMVLLLCQKCKAVFQRVQTGASDSLRYLQRLDNHSKWVRVLWLLNEVIHSCDIADMDPAVMAEVALRLAMVLESSAESAGRTVRTSGKPQEKPEFLVPAQTDPREPPALLKSSPAEQLLAAYEVLDKAVDSIARSRAANTAPDGTAITDTIRVQCLCSMEETSAFSRELDTDPVSKPGPKAVSVQSFIMDLNLELISAQHRVAIKLLNSTSDLNNMEYKDTKSLKASVSVGASSQSLRLSTESDLPDIVKKNKISKALFLMQKALLSPSKAKSSPATKQLLEEAFTLIQNAETEEKKLFLLNNQLQSRDQGESGVLAAPILLARSHRTMIFKPAPFNSEEKVSWYRIFGRSVTGSSLKVRLNDCRLRGTGEEVPAVGECLLKVEGLQPNEKYIFAVAAYRADGSMVGDAIGESTKPILACPPLPLLTAWAQLAQAAYQAGQYPVSKKAFRVLWGHFACTPPSQTDSTAGSSASKLESRTQARLSAEAASQASPLLLQLFLGSIFMQCDIHVQERALFCDSLSDGGPLIWGQVARLAECERMLVALELALWLNDQSYSLQAALQCYGLLAPLIYHKIPSVPVIKVLIKCLAVLQDLPSAFKQKRPAGAAESLRHMVACITCYTAKVLRSWQENKMALSVIDLGKKLLQETSEGRPSSPLGGQSKLPDPSEGSERTAHSKDKASGKAQSKKPTAHSEEELSEQLQALEGNFLKMKKQGDQDLTGHEDPSALYSVIYRSSLKVAYKEVLKFKRRGRFLEFVVQVMQRAVQEDQVELALTWGQEVYSWLNRRDAALRVSKKGGGAEPPGGRVGEEVKRYTVVVAEYKKGKPQSQTTPRTEKKKGSVNRKQKGPQRSQEISSRDWKAMELLVALLSPMVLGFLQRRRLRQVCADECPWRCQLNAVIALGNFAIFGKCLEQCRPLGSESYSQLDPALFSLDNAGTVVERRSSAQRSRHPEQLKTAPKPPSKLPARKGTISGAESIESDSDGEVDTPRTQLTNDIGSTYRSSSSKSVRMNVSAVEQLDKAMLHFRRAMVLAHRGGHWECLQGVCRSLWDRARLASALLDRAGGSLDQPSLTHDQLNSTLTPVLFLAADCLLDMLIHLQDSHCTLQLLQAPGVFSVSSCVGDASWEEGGSGLQWDSSLDDVTVVDLKWVRALVLYTLELLHQQKRWESLAYLAIHFNAITHERYTLQVTPLLVYAQRKLLKRIDQFGGPEAPQPHLLRAAGDSGEGVTSRNFVGKQLLIGTLSKEEIRPGSHIDPKEHNAYSALCPGADGSRAKALVSVPLDVTDTLSCFRESLEKMHYTSRALQHSRKLLALFLAHTQQDADVRNTKDSGRLCSGKVEFSVGSAQPPPPCPPDLFTEEFSSLSATQSKPLPRSQLSAVIASYCKTIELLQASKQDSLRAQALHELGNLHFYNGNKRAAYSCWSQALDSALTQPGVLTSWKESADGSDHSESFLRRAGIWGCLQGAVLTAKIAQYILTSDISQQTECCMLSALLFKALLRASLPHPWLDRDCSSYGLGEGWDVLELIPGVDLFTDQHRAEIRSTVGSLAFLTQRLHSTGHSLTVLPLLTLYEYFVSKICQDSQRTLECRILKVAVLTELRLYGDAVRELLSLLYGERMPKLTGGTCPPEKRTVKRKFDTSKPLLDPGNVQTLDELVTKRLNSELSVLFSPRMVRSLNLVKAQLLSSLCTTINEFPETQEWEPKGAVEAPANLKQRESPCLLIEAQNNRLTAARLKGFLLREAACSLFSLLDGLNTDQDPVLSQLPAASLESAVEAKLLLSAISLQQGRAAASAALALSAMRLLQDSPVFVMKSPPAPRPVFSALRLPGRKKNWQCEDDSGPVPSDLPSNAEARERMGVSQWLRCRLAVLRALSAHIPVVAIHQGRDHTADSASLLSEGIAEAEASKDTETQAELLLQAAVLDTQEGRPQGAIIPMLQEAVSLLSGRSCLSPRAGLVLARATVQLSDMKRSGPESSVTAHTHSLYTIAQRLLQQQLVTLGESLELGEGGAVLINQSTALKNIYLPHIPLLAKVTLRLGHAAAQKAACSSSREGSLQWRAAHQVLSSALELCRASGTREGDLEAEILFHKGTVERHLVYLSDFKPLAAIESFMETIAVSRAHDENLILLRRSYLEIALLYQHLSTKHSLKPPEKEKTKEKPALSPVPPARGTGKQKQVMSKGKQKTDTMKPPEVVELNQLLSWVAVRAAAQVSEASVQRALLTGGSCDETKPLVRSTLRHLPDFTLNDLLASYTDFQPGEYKEIFRDLLGPSQDEREACSGDCKSSESSGGLTWSHIVRYLQHLLQLYSVSTLPVDSPCEDRMCSSVLDTGLALRLAHLHSFLCTHLSTYQAQCSSAEPPSELLQKSPAQPQAAAGEGLEEQLADAVDRDQPALLFATSTEERELCVQWYTPALERSHTQPMVLLLYAYNTKPVTATSSPKARLTELSCGHKWIPLLGLQSLHEKLCSVRVEAELSMHHTARAEKKNRPRTLEKERPHNSQLQDQVKLCCEHVKSLLLSPSEPQEQELTELPFEWSLQSLCDLERIFDPAHSCLLTGGSVFDWITALLT
ncbi:cilia- and flagella-associated protein 54-like isoform X3 [Acipenser ruthenus]|uniref:cilia- and flagella-associated protein 54-like isoform X3 n=1 Tax=Acipenser ruthenus TaxID=7906 RepID=UPI002741F765|nr:cilia- and flagella-associated protein 54-like isoform X3 [Acipenser ruthenus]